MTTIGFGTMLKHDKPQQGALGSNSSDLQEPKDLGVLLDERKHIEKVISDTNEKLFQVIAAIIVPLVGFSGYALFNYASDIRFALLGIPFIVILAITLVGALFTELYVAGHYVRYLSNLINERILHTPLLLEKLRFDFIVRGFSLQTVFLLLAAVLICAVDALCLVLAPSLLEELSGAYAPVKKRLVVIQWSYWSSVGLFHVVTLLAFLMQYVIKTRRFRSAIKTRDWRI